MTASFAVAVGAIVEWLDKAFPARPLFSGPAEHAMVRLFDKWFGTQVLPPMFRSCVIDIFNHVKPEGRAYFRASREALLGQTLEAVAAEAHQYIANEHWLAAPSSGAPAAATSRRAEPQLCRPHRVECIRRFRPIVAVPLVKPDDPISPWLACGQAHAGAG